jgi:hypothetical protein
MMSRGVRWSPMAKFCKERWVCAPQSRSSDTSIGPNVSTSVRVPVTVSSLVVKAELRPEWPEPAITNS